MTTEQDVQDSPASRDSPASPADRRAARTLRLLRHEWTLAVIGGLVLAAVLTWPTLAHPASTIPQDIGDPILQAWQIAWGGHVLLTDPTQLWHSNTFFPERYTYAYSDTLLGYAPFGMIGSGPVAAVVRYNILYVLTHALAFVGAYALVRQLGAGRIGAAVAGVGFAFAPWKLAQAGHLHVLSIGGIALSLAMLARGHGWSLRDGYRPERRRPAWALAGWLVAAWQITLGFGIGLPFGYALALICLAAAAGYGWSWWRRRVRPPFGRRLLVADLVGGVFFAGITAFMALPYLKVVEMHPAGRRTLEHVAQFSPPLRGFVTAPPESWLWGERHAPLRETLSFAGEMTLLPGVVLIGLASAGLFFSAWSVRHRVLLAVATVISVILASGTAFGGDGDPGYATLMNVLPGWDGIRTSGRLVIWTTLLLGILAAGALTAVTTRPPATDPPTPDADRADPPASDTDRAEPAGVGAAEPAGAGAGRPVDWLLRALALVPLALVILEGVNRTPHPPPLPQPVAIRSAAEPLLVLPSYGTLEFSVMLWGTDEFPRMVNGLASFTPASQAQTQAVTASFPDAVSVAYLRDLGIRTVILLPGYAVGTPWQDVGNRPVDGLGIERREVGDAVVFEISG